MQKINSFRLDCMGLRGNSFVAFFSKRDEAEKAKAHVGGYGGEVHEEEIVIFDSAIEWKPETDEASRESGIAKLTETEKKALGLNSI